MSVKKMIKQTLAVAMAAFLTGEVAAAEPMINQGLPSFADLVEELSPSVVNISTTTKPDDNGLEPEEDMMETAAPEFRHFFENGKKQEALGSGFIIDKEGFIITNAHVINDAESIDVTLSDETVHEAKIIGKDNLTDIALIKINTQKELKPVRLGDSDKARVGDWILAIGNPFGLGGSVTAGIISAKSRDIESGQYDNFIQTDASINQGSSGGPMFNMAGEVIGINSVIFSTNGASMGIGFAIPINLADWVVKQLKADGTVHRGWIGIKIQPNNPETALAFGLEKTDGVVVSDVTIDGPAQKAGLEAGDIISGFNQEDITSPKDFSTRVAEAKIGSTAEVKIIRNGKPQSVKIKIEELKAEKPLPSTPKAAEIKQLNEDEFLVEELGFKLKPITEETIKQYHLLPNTKGMIISEVLAGSDGAEKGLKAGNVIVKMDKQDIIDIDSVKNCLNEAKMEKNRPILLLLQNGESINFVAVKLATENK